MHPYGGPGDPHYPPKERGLSKYQFVGSDLSSDPRAAMDPRSPAHASNRPRPNQPIQEEPMYPTQVPETHSGNLQDARRQGAQQQGGASDLLKLLRALGII